MEEEGKLHHSYIDETIHPCTCYLGWREEGCCVIVDDGSDGVDMGGRAILLSMTKEKRLELEVPKLSMDFMYSDALFSMIKASSSSRTILAMNGR